MFWCASDRKLSNLANINPQVLHGCKKPAEVRAAQSLQPKAAIDKAVSHAVLEVFESFFFLILLQFLCKRYVHIVMIKITKHRASFDTRE